MVESTSLKFRVGTGVMASTLTALVVWLTSTFPFAFYVPLFIVGPFAFLWFLGPALLVPPLMNAVPLERRSLPKLLLLTIAAFLASAAYLMNVESYPGNNAADLAGAAGWLAGAVLVLLAGAGYLRESRLLSACYYLVLSTWFFACAFPYTGEFCC